MSEPVIAQKFPIPTPVEAGASYYWCACGRSESQPFCDGSHAGSGIIPLPCLLYTSPPDMQQRQPGQPPQPGQPGPPQQNQQQPNQQ